MRRQIVCGQYVADYSTTECRTFRPKGLRQLRTNCSVSSSVLYAADEGLRAKTSCIHLLNNLLRIAHKLFAYIEQHSNEPLLLHYLPDVLQGPVISVL